MDLKKSVNKPFENASCQARGVFRILFRDCGHQNLTFLSVFFAAEFV